MVMKSNTFLILLILSSILVGIAGGYFVFLGIYHDQFQQAKRINLNNFDSATVILKGSIINTQNNVVTIAKGGINFPLQVTKDTAIFVPDTQGLSMAIIKTGRAPLKKGTIADFSLGQIASVVAVWNNSNFQAISITAFSVR